MSESFKALELLLDQRDPESEHLFIPVKLLLEIERQITRLNDIIQDGGRTSAKQCARILELEQKIESQAAEIDRLKAFEPKFKIGQEVWCVVRVAGSETDTLVKANIDAYQFYRNLELTCWLSDVAIKDDSVEFIDLDVNDDENGNILIDESDLFATEQEALESLK